MVHTHVIASGKFMTKALVYAKNRKTLFFGVELLAPIEHFFVRGSQSHLERNFMCSLIRSHTQFYPLTQSIVFFLCSNTQEQGN